MKKLNLSIFFGILLYGLPAQAATLSTKIEPKQVMPGQAFQLILDLDENAPAGLPDFSPLQYDFQINGTAHRASYMFINGQSKASSSWTVTLTPKHTGTLTIPAIQVGHARSKPSSIEVTKTPHVSSNTDNIAPTTALFIQTMTNESNPFINQQITYTVKIYHNTSVLDASYQPPQLNDALTMPLGENRQYQVIEGGRPYLVEEQKYAFFPQQSGVHTLYPPSFQALIYDDIPRRVRADGQSKSLHVKAIPESFQNKPWIPAKSLALTEHYDQHDTTFHEGSTLTRTLTLRAAGLPAELLPSLDMPKSTAFNTYTERPIQDTEIHGQDVVGKITVKINYLFNQTGQVTLPEQTITWYNTETGKREHSTLPERILNITKHTQADPQKSPEPGIRELEETENTAPANTLTFKHVLGVHLALVCLILVFLGLFVFNYLNNKYQYFMKRRAFKTFAKACRRNQPQAAQDALFAWAKLTWPQHSFLNLDDIAKKASNANVSTQIKILSTALYSSAQSNTWHGEELLTALRQLIQKRLRRTKKTAPNDLPPINP